MVFMFAFPLSINLNHGLWGNVGVPTILSMTLLGFEIVADFMENPLGDDSADISIYELIHEFEVEVEVIFDCSEQDRPAVLRAWADLGTHCGLEQGSRLFTQEE